MTALTTYLGKQYSLTTPVADDIDPRDIAHSLAHLCRFNGHTKTFYSVAQHSCLVADLVPPEHRLSALLHNAAEAYIGHMIEPLKQCVMFYRDLERLHWARICKRFDIDPQLPESVRNADRIVTATERRDLVKNAGPACNSTTHSAPMAQTIQPWRIQKARDIYFQQLMDQLAIDHRRKAI